MDISGHFTGFAGGTLMSLIAFSIVFLVCIGLMLMMMALKHISAAIDKAAEEKEAKAAAAVVAAPAAAPAARISAVAAEDEGEIVAVITAAIVASCGAGAKILSIKPAAPRVGASAWRMTGILQNTEGLSESF